MMRLPTVRPFIRRSCAPAVCIGVIALTVLQPGPAAAQVGVRVVKNDAVVRLNPEGTSLALAQVKIGTILEVTRKQGPWYVVILPADQTGLRRSGFISGDDVEPYDTTDGRPAPPRTDISAAANALLPAPVPRRALAPDWQDRYDAASSKQRLGLTLFLAGLAVEGLSFAIDAGKDYDETDWALRWTMIAIGGAISVPGGLIWDSAKKQKRVLEEERRRALQGRLQQKFLIQLSERPVALYTLSW